jgi:hypothetical protein
VCGKAWTSMGGETRRRKHRLVAVCSFASTRNNDPSDCGHEDSPHSGGPCTSFPLSGDGPSMCLLVHRHFQNDRCRTLMLHRRLQLGHDVVRRCITRPRKGLPMDTLCLHHVQSRLPASLVEVPSSPQDDVRGRHEVRGEEVRALNWRCRVFQVVNTRNMCAT